MLSFTGGGSKWRGDISSLSQPIRVRCGHFSSISSHYLYGGSGHTAASCTSTTTEETAGAAAVCVPEIHHDLYTKGKGECTGCWRGCAFYAQPRPIVEEAVAPHQKWASSLASRLVITMIMNALLITEFPSWWRMVYKWRAWTWRNMNVLLNIKLSLLFDIVTVCWHRLCSVLNIVHW